MQNGPQPFSSPPKIKIVGVPSLVLGSYSLWFLERNDQLSRSFVVVVGPCERRSKLSYNSPLRAAVQLISSTCVDRSTSCRSFERLVIAHVRRPTKELPQVRRVSGRAGEQSVSNIMRCLNCSRPQHVADALVSERRIFHPQGYSLFVVRRR